MIRRETWLTLAALVILVGLAWYLNSRSKNDDLAALNLVTPAATQDFDYVFEVDRTQVASVVVTDLGTNQTGQVVRGEDGDWVMQLPYAASADQALAQTIASQSALLRITDTLDPATQLGVVGLDKPRYRVTIRLADGQEHTAVIGGLSVTGNSYYVKGEDGQVRVVSVYSIDTLLRLLTAPPYLETATPSPTPTETATPTLTPAATLTPEATATASMTATP